MKVKLEKKEKQIKLLTQFGNRTLREAVDAWCDPERRQYADAKYGHISGWDTSEVTDMKHLFYADNRYGPGGTTAQISDDISGWNVGRVESMGYIFYHAESFNSDLSGWKVAKCKDMQSMFEGAKRFKKDCQKLGFKITKE